MFLTNLNVGLLAIFIASHVVNHHCDDSNYVLTKFNLLESYVDKLVTKTGFQSGTEMKSFTARASYCLGLLNARVFERYDEYQIRNALQPKLQGYTIQKIHFLKFYRKLKEESSSLRYCLVQYELLPFWTEECLSHDLQYKWIATFNSDLSTGLLFKKDSIVELHALVDKSAELVIQSSYNLKHKFLQYTDTKQSEMLCRLKKNSIFRLCSICADTIDRAHPKTPKKPNLHSNNSEVVFTELYNNFQYMENTIDTCLSLKILIDDGSIKQSVLHCNVSVNSMLYKFYLKVGTNSNYSAFIMMPEEFDESRIHLWKEIHIPQLPNILNVDNFISRGR